MLSAVAHSRWGPSTGTWACVMAWQCNLLVIQKQQRSHISLFFRGLPVLAWWVHLFFNWSQRASCRQPLSRLDHIIIRKKCRAQTLQNLEAKHTPCVITQMQRQQNKRLISSNLASSERNVYIIQCFSRKVFNRETEKDLLQISVSISSHLVYIWAKQTLAFHWLPIVLERSRPPAPMKHYL